MSKFAFKAGDYMPGGKSHDKHTHAFDPGEHSTGDDTYTELGAQKVRGQVASQGHDARIEKSSSRHDPEHRVWVQHPKHEDVAAYVRPEDFKEGKWTPYWIQK